MRAQLWLMIPALLVTAARAGVSATEAAHLGQDLTPVGAQAAGNAEGTIPAWVGASWFDDEVKAQTAATLEAMRQHFVDLRAQDSQDFELLQQRLDPLTIENSPALFQQLDAIDSRLPKEAQSLASRLRLELGGGDKYQKPTFVIDHDNLARYTDHLTAGQRGLFARYADYRMIVYPSLRNAFFPEAINRATRRNATEAELKGTDEVHGAVLGFPFPIPKSGAEVIWNHKMAYRGASLRRYNNQAIVRADGSYKISKLIEEIKFKYANLKESNPGTRILFDYLSDILSPPRVAGQALLIHETSGAGGSGREAWLYDPGLGRINRAPDVGYDNPSIGSDGEQFNDQIDVFNGALDRYDWKLLGKKDIYIPYNSYFLISPLVLYKDIIRPGHINQNLLRYELHRVWVVDATLKAGQRHQFSRRTFYVDEDGWAIVAVDCYDGRGQLWKVQESELITVPFAPTVSGVAEAIYDLQSGRYFVTALQNEDRFIDFQVEFKDEYFAPTDLAQRSRLR